MVAAVKDAAAAALVVCGAGTGGSAADGEFGPLDESGGVRAIELGINAPLDKALEMGSLRLSVPGNCGPSGSGSGAGNGGRGTNGRCCAVFSKDRAVLCHIEKFRTLKRARMSAYVLLPSV